MLFSYRCRTKKENSLKVAELLNQFYFFWAEFTFKLSLLVHISKHHQNAKMTDVVKTGSSYLFSVVRCVTPFIDVCWHRRFRIVTVLRTPLLNLFN